MLTAGLAVVLSAGGCSSWDQLIGSGAGRSTGGSTASRISDEPGTGSVGIQLDLAAGTTLTSAQWTISNGTNTYFGVVTIGDAQSLEFVQGDILAGSGYTVRLDANDSEDDVCTGTSPPFAVAAGAVAQTVLMLTCRLAPIGSSPGDVNTGTLEVDASVAVVGDPVPCPGIRSFSISPAAITLGQTAALTLATVGPPSQITWSVNPPTGGTFEDANAATTTFACAPGAAFVPQVTITATVALPGNDVCDGQRFTSMSALVNCLAPASGGL